MEDIAQRIKELIDSQSLTNTDFAKRTNINPAIISHILSGRNKPSLQVINQIKDAFTNVNTDYLIGGKGALYNEFTNVNTDFPPAESMQANMFPMEGVRIASVPGDVPLPPPEEEIPEQNSTAQEEKQQSSPPPQLHENADNKDIEQIVIFYTDGSFKAYRP